MVYIKKVEIFGFRSFGYKTAALELQPGLVSIAGPNGSGKSTILDAIIFALGENRPKNLRAPRMSRLLANSGDRRHGPKIAKCSVYFDNADKKMPVDSDKVKITRELDENGESVYYLNGKKIQRQHMLALLEAANAELTAINAVRQGTVQKLSYSTNDEKRGFIEDLAGLAVFDEKKAAAVKELDMADRKLEVFLARSGDMESRVAELEEERNLKLRYDALEAEIERYQRISAANKLVKLGERKQDVTVRYGKNSARIDELATHLRAIGDQIRTESGKKEQTSAQAGTHQQAKSAIEGEMAQARIAFQDTDNQIKSMEATIASKRNRRTEIDKEIPNIQSKMAGLQTDMASFLDDKSNLTAKISESDAVIKSIHGKKSTVLERQDGIAAKSAILEDRIGRINGKLRHAHEILSDTESKIRETASTISRNADKISNIKKILPSLELAKKRLDAILERNSAAAESAQQSMHKLEPQKKKMLSRMNRLRPFLSDADVQVAAFDGKIKMIKSLMHEDYSISRLKDNAEKLGIIGTAYEVLSWDKEYERAVLAAGTDWLKALVVKDFDTLYALAEYARMNSLPRIRMIACEDLPVLEPGGRLPRSLADHVQCKPEHASVREFLFRGIVLAESKDEAHRTSQSGLRAVTLDGELFEPGLAAAVVDADSKISDLTRTISMSSTVEDLLRLISNLKQYFNEYESAIQRVDGALSEQAARLQEAQKRISTASSTSMAGADIASSKNSVKYLETVTSILKQKHITLCARAACQRSKVESLKQQADILYQNRPLNEQREISSRLSDLDRQKHAIESAQTLTHKSMVNLTVKMSSTESGIANLADTAARLQAEHHELGSDLTSLEEQVAKLLPQREEQEGVLQKLRDKEQEMLSISGNFIFHLKEHDKKLESLRAAEKENTAEKSKLHRHSDSLERDLRILDDDIKTQIGIAQGANPQPEHVDIDDLLAVLKNEMSILFPKLNAQAPTLYAKTSELYRSTSQRKNILKKDRDKIVEFIESIEKDKRQTFLDAFDTVNNDIRQTFPRLANGNAWLEFEDEDDVLNSGISYIIQFPKKPKLESSELSGGEQALASIAFIMALQKLNSSQFYLFDEVDASLDAHNAGRLASILVERSQASQFIMVSHKDTLVKNASLVYGVYPKNGISTIIKYPTNAILPQQA